MALFDRLKEMLHTEGKVTEVDIVLEQKKNSSENLAQSVFDDKDDKVELVNLLTPREAQVFRLLLEGYTLKEVAKTLSIQYSTANTHMTTVYKKLKVSSRPELIIKYRGIGNNL